MVNSVQLRKEKYDLVRKSRQILDRAGERDLNTEEDSEYNKLQSSIDELDKRIHRLETVEDQEKNADDDDDKDMEKCKKRDDEDDADEDSEESKRNRYWGGREERSRLATTAYRKKWMLRLLPELGRGKYANDEYRSLATRPEYRDIVLGAEGTDTTGGYFATPVKIADGFIIAVNNLSFMRKVAKVESYSEAKSLGVRQMTTQPSAAWSGEVVQVSPDTSTTLARRDLNPNLASCLVNISLRMLQASNDAEAIMMDRINYQIGILAEEGYIAGSGDGEPLGIFTGSSSGIPTSQDTVANRALAKLFNLDDFYTTLYSLPQQYRLLPSFAIFGHRSTAAYIRTLKDAVGHYLWQPSIVAGEPDSLAGYKFFQSEYAPSLNVTEPTASQYVLCMGAFEYYVIADVVGVDSPQIQRLVERFADQNEIGLMGRFWTDGSPVLPNAFARLKLAAS